jgi:hypothetical protein
VCSKLAFMAAGEPELCTSSPIGHLRRISVTMTGSAVVSSTPNLRHGSRWVWRREVPAKLGVAGLVRVATGRCLAVGVLPVRRPAP